MIIKYLKNMNFRLVKEYSNLKYVLVNPCLYQSDTHMSVPIPWNYEFLLQILVLKKFFECLFKVALDLYKINLKLAYIFLLLNHDTFFNFEKFSIFSLLCCKLIIFFESNNLWNFLLTIFKNHLIRVLSLSLKSQLQPHRITYFSTTYCFLWRSFACSY